jgi:hypothetical protein
MSYTAQEGYERMRSALRSATHQLDGALQSLRDAHELLDEHLSERLEDELFRPVRRACGEARRAYLELPGTSPGESEPPPARGVPSHGAKAFIQDAVEATGRADEAIIALQDSMLPVEFGDPKLRARLSAIREQLAGVPRAARELLRVLGR